MLIGTILSELNLSHEFVLGLSLPKLRILYLEAMRQRTNKAFMLMEMLGCHRLEHQNDRRNVIEGYKKYTNPFSISVELDSKQIDHNWDTLRVKNGS